MLTFFQAEVFVLIPRFSKRSTFFCSSVFLDEAIKTPTAFCQVQGAAVQYISLVLGGWFVVYNATLLKVGKHTSIMYKMIGNANKLPKIVIWWWKWLQGRIQKNANALQSFKFFSKKKVVWQGIFIFKHYLCWDYVAKKMYCVQTSGEKNSPSHFTKITII